MNRNPRRTAGLLVLGMVAAIPLAFAGQDASPTAAKNPPPASMADGQPAAQSSGGQGLSWAELDADGNGNLSRQEAQRHAALGKVFTEADADADGELTANEYRAYLQKRQGESTTTPGN
ncbi:MAG: EF-hand domain-containing protein [Pseudoxanthomonas sp.]|nr:EF-hand domain-containing protein [Pseudoxanthomonas sp.]